MDGREPGIQLVLRGRQFFGRGSYRHARHLSVDRVSHEGGDRKGASRKHEHYLEQATEDQAHLLDTFGG